MSGLPPRKPPVETFDLEPRVLDVTDDADAEVVAALSSDTARRTLSELYTEPATQSALADRVGTSIQNVGHHLDRLVAIGLVTVIEQYCSENGCGMDVYAPANRTVIFVAGDLHIITGSWDTAREAGLENAAVQSSE
jgi:DNA-binding transcriptional ArsR family regulator